MPSRKSPASSSKKTRSWQENCQGLVKVYLKKIKAPKGSLFVLSTYGDVLFKAGKEAKLDFTTLGSLAASTAAASEGLSELLRFKGSPIILGAAKDTLWFERLGQEALLVGWKCGWNSAALKPLTKVLKKNFGTPHARQSAEALDGMTAESLESQFNERMRKP